MEDDEKKVYVKKKVINPGPNKDKIAYSLSAKRNKEVDKEREGMSMRQSGDNIEKKRRTVEGKADYLGGRVSWGENKRGEYALALKMTTNEYEKLSARAAEIGKKLDRIEEMRSGKKATDYEHRLADVLISGKDVYISGNEVVHNAKGLDIDTYNATKKDAEKLMYNSRTPLEVNGYLKKLDKDATQLIGRLEKVLSRHK